MMNGDFNGLVISLHRLENCRGRGPRPGTGIREFHVSRECRDRYDFPESLFALSGNVLFADFPAVRRFVQKMNREGDLQGFPPKGAKAGHINAMGLMDEIFHYVIRLYSRQENSRVMNEALAFCQEKIGGEALDKTLLQFVEEFPPPVVYRGEIDARSYLSGNADALPPRARREAVLEEMLMLRLANLNPAFSPYRELFDDRRLEKDSAYPEVWQNLNRFFESQPPFGPGSQNLLQLLRSPGAAAPGSLERQLKYIKGEWDLWIEKYHPRLLQAQTLLKKEEKKTFPGPGDVEPRDWRKRQEEETGEYERFSPDTPWMPRLILLARNIYVWLDQLSKKYQRPIDTLDQIPDEELDRLGEMGFTGLWLIGVWERSPASQKIKQMCGNPEAAASAYSIYRYAIAPGLGGDRALENLENRALQRGIRLGADMVPNHLGIDSPLVVEHPDWFLNLEYSPFPAYTFNGVNLSRDERVEIYLEDHYYDRSDAAVVFKWVDRDSGQTRYIYHGNDGTAMPWNDTAQLNYLLPEVREAVLQVILEAAKKFPIIRFDAAMTLTRRHYRRLWFPEPGTGEDIPSRAEYGMNREVFDERMPREFFREMVDRVAEEAPDTLLLAEAFWLMESYFVRTLGMHRVYNSAFMNLLKNEENRKYRAYLKDILAFDPEILRRFVNFMSNPDEEPAAVQFGKGDKYFGICTLMVTMPGLPMFGHGQVEGLIEKYGMEYRRAYRDEQPDEPLIQRHRREIFPLMRQRRLFSGVENFLLYDFFTPEGAVDEDVFAYSNRSGSQKCLVVYHNRYDETRGWIGTSVPYKAGSPRGGKNTLRQESPGRGLGLHHDRHYYLVFRDRVSGLEYICPNKELFNRGLYIELAAYQLRVFLDFREVKDNRQHHYARLADRLRGKGVPDMERARREIAES